MQTLPVTPTPAARGCLSPITIWQILLTHLLAQHYGLTLNGTTFSDEATIREHIESGISLSDAVNFLVEKYELVRTGFTIMGSHRLSPRLIFFTPDRQPA